MTARDRHIAEIKRMTDALEKTKSKHLINDYKKGIARLKRELKEYDQWQLMEVQHGNS